MGERDRGMFYFGKRKIKLEVGHLFYFYFLNQKCPRRAKTVHSIKGKAESITIFYLKLYYRGTVIKTAWYFHKIRPEDKWKRSEKAKTN